MRLYEYTESGKINYLNYFSLIKLKVNITNHTAIKLLFKNEL